MAPLGPSATLVRYLVIQVPGWLLAFIVAWSLVRWLDLPTWAAAALVGIVIVKDLALYPTLRRFYEAASHYPPMIGETGVAITDLTPAGFVRVHGELWQAEVASAATLPAGSGVRVRDIRGLLLIVDGHRGPHEQEPTEHQLGRA